MSEERCDECGRKHCAHVMAKIGQLAAVKAIAIKACDEAEADAYDENCHADLYSFTLEIVDLLTTTESEPK
jgi:hypothetical protein